jgi:uncharacterized delta-60 repeat protein
MRSWIAAVVVASFLVASPTALAAGRAGQLDRGFSGDGKLVTAFPPERSASGLVDYALPFEFSPGRIAMAGAGGAKIVAANSRAIVEYLPSGRPNPRFGGNGAVPIGAIEGSRFQLADVAVDSRGRVLVAGTTRPDTKLGMEGLAVPGPIPSLATIRRYLPNGRLDPSFGSEGVLNTDLGAGPPTFEGQAYSGSAVAVVGLAVDGTRPIVTGSAVSEVGRCTPSQNRYQASQAIVARLSENGALDPTFADGGLQAIAGLSWLGSPTMTPAGLVVTGTNVDPCPRGGPLNPSVLVRLADDGSIDRSFAANGFWSRPFTRISGLAAAPAGKLVLLARTIELFRGRWIESAGTAVRLRGDGSFDRSFGQGGRAEPKLSKSREILQAIEVDGRGRVLLLGDAWRKRRKALQARFLLMRLTEAGTPDRDFGKRGRVLTGFGPRPKVTNILGSDVMLNPRGRIVVGGKIAGRSIGNGFAVARYLGRDEASR